MDNIFIKYLFSQDVIIYIYIIVIITFCKIIYIMLYKSLFNKTEISYQTAMLK